MINRLRTTQALRDLCGFGGAAPSGSALSLFTSRLADHADLIENAITRVTNQLRDLIPQVCRPKGQLQTRRDKLKPLGHTLPTNGSVVNTFTNGKQHTPSNPDAEWGTKNDSKSYDGKPVMIFDYKMHLTPN